MVTIRKEKKKEEERDVCVGAGRRQSAPILLPHAALCGAVIELVRSVYVRISQLTFYQNWIRSFIGYSCLFVSAMEKTPSGNGRPLQPSDVLFMYAI